GGSVKGGDRRVDVVVVLGFDVLAHGRLAALAQSLDLCCSHLGSSSGRRVIMIAGALLQRKESQMKKLLLGGSLALLVGVLVVTVALANNNGHRGARAFLQGYSEVPANSTTGHGDFKAKVENGSITYRLRY